MRRGNRRKRRRRQTGILRTVQAIALLRNSNRKTFANYCGDLKIDRGAFDPKSEAELDDITEEWEVQAEGFGHQVDLCEICG